MKIYTCYFAMARHFPVDLQMISISRFAPKGFVGPSLYSLAPSKELLAAYKQNQDEVAYTQNYREHLKKLVAADIVKELSRLSNGKDCVLLCYEKTGSFCHRHLVANWLNEAGYDVQEWTKT